MLMHLYQWSSTIYICIDTINNKLKFMSNSHTYNPPPPQDYKVVIYDIVEPAEDTAVCTVHRTPDNLMNKLCVSVFTKRREEKLLLVLLQFYMYMYGYESIHCSQCKKCK